MKCADLSRSGTWVCLFLLNTSVIWPLNSSAFSRSDRPTPFPSLLFRVGIPWVSFSNYWCSERKEVTGVCLNITNQGIHIQIMLFSYIRTSLIFLLKVAGFYLSLLLPVFFAYAWVICICIVRWSNQYWVRWSNQYWLLFNGRVRNLVSFC